MKALDDEDVLKIYKIITDECKNPKDLKEFNNIATKYSLILFDILNICKKKHAKNESQKNSLDRLTNILRFCPHDEIFIRSMGKVWNVRDRFETRDVEYLMNRDYSALIKKDVKQDIILTIMDAVKKIFNTLPPQEKEYFWGKANELLSLITSFKKLVNNRV